MPARACRRADAPVYTAPPSMRAVRPALLLRVHRTQTTRFLGRSPPLTRPKFVLQQRTCDAPAVRQPASFWRRGQAGAAQKPACAARRSSGERRPARARAGGARGRRLPAGRPAQRRGRARAARPAPAHHGPARARAQRARLLPRERGHHRCARPRQCWSAGACPAGSLVAVPERSSAECGRPMPCACPSARSGTWGRPGAPAGALMYLTERAPHC